MINILKFFWSYGTKLECDVRYFGSEVEDKLCKILSFHDDWMQLSLLGWSAVLV
jgi:hypothetical protein